MLTLAYYFLQVLLCSALLMGYYWLVLRNNRFHQYNRFYLLAVVGLSWLVPLIKIRWGHAAADTGMAQLLAVVADNNTYLEQTISQKGFAWSSSFVIAGLYAAVSAAMLFALVLAFVRIYTLLKEHSCRTVGEVYLVLTRAKGTPFSFFRYIFWNEEIDLRSESGKQILQHELTHVQQKHSIDKVLIQCMLVVGWFNPFFWLLKREMEMIHEFIADNKSVKHGDTAALAQLLLMAAYPGQHFSLVHPFFFSPIKRRLQMLANTKHPRFSYLRRLVVLPLLALLVVLFAFRNKEAEGQVTISVAALMEKVAVKAERQVKQNEKLSGPATVAMKKYPGATDTLLPVLVDTIALPGKKRTQLQQNAANPETPVLNQAKPGGLAASFGKALVVVDGKKIDRALLDIIDPAKIASVDVYKQEKAKALYGEEGKNGVIVITTQKNPSTPGALQLRAATESPILKDNIPVDRAAGSKLLAETGLPNPEKQKVEIPSDVLVIIDGVKGGDLNTLSPEQIASIHVLKNETALSLYGEEGKHGVVLVTTQKKRFKAITGIHLSPHGEVVEEKVFTRTEVPASFPGGNTAWLQYLQRSQNLDLLLARGAPAGRYTVWVSFLIDKNGDLSEVAAENDPGYGLAAEAVRIIRKSPQWKPAEQNGLKVSSRYRQIVSWQVPAPLAAKTLAANAQVVTDKKMQNAVHIQNTKEAIRKQAEQKLVFFTRLRARLANNTHTFFDVDGKSGVAGNAGAYAFLSSSTDIVFVNGKRMTPAALNTQYLRSQFRFMAADETPATIRKYGKGVLVVADQSLTPAELKNVILQ